MRYLARRDHSRAELRRKLASHGTPDEIEDVLNRMTELGLLCDRRFAEAWVRGKATRFGVSRLRHDLAQRGVARETIEEALATECGGDDLERARSVWNTRFGTAPGDPRAWAKQARFLQSRGFAGDVIRKLLKETPNESA